MRPPRLLASLAALALLAAGCGFSVEGGSAESSGAEAPPTAGACLAGATGCDDTGGDMGAPPPDGDPPTTPTAMEVEPVDGLEDVHPVAWDGVEVDPDDPSRVTVRWTSGVAPCHTFAGVEATFTDDTVTLTVREGSVPADEPQACIELAQFKQAMVDLDQEVGPRSIVDGAG